VAGAGECCSPRGDIGEEDLLVVVLAGEGKTEKKPLMKGQLVDGTHTIFERTGGEGGRNQSRRQARVGR